MKVSIVGAGAVGATLAQRVLESGIADVVLIDIAKDLAIGKAFDLLDASPIIAHERMITGTDDYSQTASSDIIVITAGFPRKPGMTREDLIAKNVSIVKEVSDNIKKYSPGSIVIVVTNPLDVMTYMVLKRTGFGREKVFGMAGVLDSSRFIHLISHELKVPRSSVRTLILGSHGDTMVPLVSQTFVSDRPVTEVMPKDKLDAIIQRTRDRGAEIVKLFGSGSAYYSPSAAVFKMIDVILKDKKETLVISACLDGEFALKDVAIGVPCKLGRSGIEEIIVPKMSKEEDAAFRESAKAIKSSIGIL